MWVLGPGSRPVLGLGGCLGWVVALGVRSGYWVWDTGCGMLRSGILGLGHWVWDIGFGTLGLGL